MPHKFTFDQKQQRVVDSQITENKDQNTRIGLRIAASPTVLNRPAETKVYFKANNKSH